MKALIFMRVLAIAVITLFVVNGCIFNQPENDQDNPVNAIDQINGGFTTTDESEAFGDPTLATEFADDAAEVDLMETDPKVATDLNNPKIKVHFLRIAWGLMKFDSSATQIVDWKGKAEINKGTLLVLKRIRFENDDYIVRPRKNKQSVEWVSFTQPHFDGVALAIMDNDTSKKNIAGQFTLSAGAYTRTFTFDELDSLKLVVPVGNNGHEVAIVTHKKVVEPFAGGFLEGRWTRKDSSGGVFFGKWINSLGTRVGYIKGIWGVDRFGHQVLYGKWIELNGRFGGILAGTWKQGHDKNHGTLEGNWVNRSLTAAGRFEAQWETGATGSGKGFFQGKWRRKL
ncbi:hypothetical protein L0128_14305 [candidate division KSB1 bacterium]|nr:hypothetical protein [candidate division KSB1 bacterium]